MFAGQLYLKIFFLHQMRDCGPIIAARGSDCPSTAGLAWPLCRFVTHTLLILGTITAFLWYEVPFTVPCSAPKNNSILGVLER